MQKGREETGERRLAAIMFTDIVGYTSLTQKDESLSLRLLGEHRSRLRPFFERFNGKEIKTIGDGILVEFPSSLSAVQCAYEIQTNLNQLNKNVDKGSGIQIRIGIHVGDVIHASSDIYGDAVNIASRIESVCEPGGISVSEEIYQQVRNKVSFAFESVGEQKLKNVEHPLEIFKVNISSSVSTDNFQQQQQLFAAHFLNQELPFTNRILETQALRNELDKTSATKQGSLVLISGEPGIGKSRLANEMKIYATGKNFSWLSTTCTRSEDSAPYSPWIQLLREFANRAPTQLFYKICGPYVNQIVRLIPELAESSGVTPFHPSSIRDPSQEVDVEATERRQFFQGLTQFFLRLSKESSGLVLHFDDLQWADQATLQLLKFFLSSTLGKEPIAILLSYRDVEANSGENEAVARFLKDMDYERKGLRLVLKRFEEPDVGKLLASLSAQRDVSFEFTDLIYSKTGGNPFFIGEVLKSLIEKQDIFANERGQWDRKPITQIQVPTSIRTLIQERVARLDIDTCKMLQTASVMGDTFDPGIVRDVIQDELYGERVDLALANALSTGFVAKRENVFAFVDESLRDVLLDQVNSQFKISIHQKAALAFERLANENVSLKNELASLIAYHYLSSGVKPKALEFSIIAGDRSANLFAHEEAVRHYSIAADLTSNEEPKAKLLRSLGDEIWFIGDFRKSLDYWTRAAETYEKIGDRATASDLYRRIGFTYHTPLLDKDNSIHYFNKAISLLEDGPSLAGWELAAAYINAGIVYAWDGQTEKARQIFEKGRKLALDSNNRFIESIAAYTWSWIADVKDKDSVLRDCEQAIDYLVETSNIRQASFAYAAKAGWYATIKGPSKETLRVHEEAMSYAERAGVNTAVFALKTSLAATVDLPLGRFSEVRNVVELMQRMASSSPSLLAMKCYYHLISGLLQLYLGDLTESKENLLQVTKIAKGFGNSSFAVQPYLALGRIFLYERDFSEAEKFLLIAREISNKRTWLRNVTFHVELIALQIELAVGSKKNSLKETFDLLLEMKEISKEIAEPWVYAHCLRAEGLIALNQIKLEESIHLLSESASIWASLGRLHDQANTDYEIALGYSKMGDVSNARKHNHEALSIFSSLGAKLDIEKCLALDNDLQGSIELPKFLNPMSRITFDYLVSTFIEDYSMKNLNPQSSGWRTLREIAKHTGSSPSSLYFRVGSRGSDSTLHNLLSTKIVESKTFKGERGRGGEVTRYRINYEKSEVKGYADRLIELKSAMLL